MSKRSKFPHRVAERRSHALSQRMADVAEYNRGIARAKNHADRERLTQMRDIAQRDVTRLQSKLKRTPPKLKENSDVEGT